MTEILLLLFVAVFWLVIAFYFVKLVTLVLPITWWRFLVRMALFLALLPLPLIDEIVGKRQFEKLCSEHATIQIDRAKAVGKTVYLAVQPDVEIKGTWVRVVLKPWRYVDATTGETVVSYDTLRAVGGRLIRALGISEGGIPLTFKSTCVPTNRPASLQSFRELGIDYVEPPTLKRTK